MLAIGGGSELGAVGQVYVFGRSKGTWLLGATLTSGASADGFGLSLALSRGTLVVGAPRRSPTTGTSTGQVASTDTRASAGWRGVKPKVRST